MALTTTTLSAAVTATARSIKVASATGFSAGYFILVDSEMMRTTQDYVAGTTTVGVIRGVNGTKQKAHVTTANATTGLGSDFNDPAEGGPSNVYPTQRATLLQSITATSTLALPQAGSDLRVILNGTSVITLTVPVPTKDMDGCELTIVGNGAAAHLLTFTGGLSGAGGSYDIFTVNATAPVAVKVIACNGVWVAFTAPAWTGTVTALVGGIA